MRAMRALTLPLVLAFSLLSAAAFADVDCPVGTKKKTEGPNEWCEPVVCLTDAQCGAGEVCKPVPLCIEIGTVKNAAGQDAGQRLMARQHCGPDRACPSSTTCLDGSRCISKAEADKLGLLAPAPSASAAAPPAPSDKKCGCSVVGAPSSSGAIWASLACAALGAVAIAARRRQGAPRPTRRGTPKTPSAGTQ